MDPQNPDRPPGDHPDDHPDEVDIDALRSGETDPRVAEHVAACDHCRARLNEFERLATALSMPVPEAPIPPERDAAILDIADQAARHIRGRRRRFQAIPLVAAAAALVLVFATWSLMTSSQTRSGQDTGPLVVSNQDDIPAKGPADVNRDGTIDILDAFLVARTVRDRDELPDEWDFNGDGAVDQGDAEWLGQSAVSVSGEIP